MPTSTFTREPVTCVALVVSTPSYSQACTLPVTPETMFFTLATRPVSSSACAGAPPWGMPSGISPICGISPMSGICPPDGMPPCMPWPRLPRWLPEAALCAASASTVVPPSATIT